MSISNSQIGLWSEQFYYRITSTQQPNQNIRNTQQLSTQTAQNVTNAQPSRNAKRRDESSRFLTPTDDELDTEKLVNLLSDQWHDFSKRGVHVVHVDTNESAELLRRCIEDGLTHSSSNPTILDRGEDALNPVLGEDASNRNPNANSNPYECEQLNTAEGKEMADVGKTPDESTNGSSFEDESRNPNGNVLLAEGQRGSCEKRENGKCRRRRSKVVSPINVPMSSVLVELLMAEEVILAQGVVMLVMNRLDIMTE